MCASFIEYKSNTSKYITLTYVNDNHIALRLTEIINTCSCIIFNTQIAAVLKLHATNMQTGYLKKLDIVTTNLCSWL